MNTEIITLLRESSVMLAKAANKLAYALERADDTSAPVEAPVPAETAPKTETPKETKTPAADKAPNAETTAPAEHPTKKKTGKRKGKGRTFEVENIRALDALYEAGLLHYLRASFPSSKYPGTMKYYVLKCEETAKVLAPYLEGDSE